MSKTVQVQDWVSRRRDPWRLRCPECDSTRIDYSVSTSIRCKESDSWYGDFEIVERFENGRENTGRYRCDSCKATLDYVRDAKTDELIRKRRTTIQ